jgi:hypothetical protein
MAASPTTLEQKALEAVHILERYPANATETRIVFLDAILG